MATRNTKDDVRKALARHFASMATSQHCHAGKRIFVVRAGTEGSSVMLEVWDSNRALQEFAVPKDLHGSVLNEAWLSNGAVWTPDESRVAYVAEACRAVDVASASGHNIEQLL